MAADERSRQFRIGERVVAGGTEARLYLLAVSAGREAGAAADRPRVEKSGAGMAKLSRRAQRHREFSNIYYRILNKRHLGRNDRYELKPVDDRN